MKAYTSSEARIRQVSFKISYAFSSHMWSTGRWFMENSALSKSMAKVQLLALATP